MLSDKIVILCLCALLSLCITLTLAGDAEESKSSKFFEIDVNKVDDKWPVRFGVKFWDVDSTRYQKLIKTLGPVFNTGHWPTLWEVSSAAPAPHESSDERMDAWVDSIYRNLRGKKETMPELSDILVNGSVEVIGFCLGPPEAYALMHQQKKYRAEKKAEKEGVELDPNIVYYNGMDVARLDDFSKFIAASLDRVASFGTKIPYVEMIDQPAVADQMGLYVSPKEYGHIIKKTREELDARGLKSDKVKILAPGVEEPSQLKPYLERLVEDREAYDALYAYTVHILDRGGSLLEIQEMAEKLRADIKKTIPQSWGEKPVAVSGFRYNGPDEVEYHGMRFYGNIYKCYNAEYQKKNHMVLKETLPLSPWYAVRLLAGLTIQMSHGLPWVVYNQGADQWWERTCDGLLDRDNRPKQILAAFESFLPFLTNESYPIKKQWKNKDDCYISAFRSDKVKTRVVLTVTNVSPAICERSFSIKGLDLWDIQKAKVTTYNNGTVSVTADKPYRALLTSKLLHYDVFDSDDGSGSDIEFDLTVGPYASATAVIDSKMRKKKSNKKTTLEVEIEHSEL